MADKGRGSVWPIPESVGHIPQSQLARRLVRRSIFYRKRKRKNVKEGQIIPDSVKPKTPIFIVIVKVRSNPVKANQAIISTPKTPGCHASKQQNPRDGHATRSPLS
jgi:hypothetical protein